MENIFAYTHCSNIMSIFLKKNIDRTRNKKLLEKITHNKNKKCMITHENTPWKCINKYLLYMLNKDYKFDILSFLSWISPYKFKFFWIVRSDKFSSFPLIIDSFVSNDRITHIISSRELWLECYNSSQNPYLYSGRVWLLSIMNKYQLLFLTVLIPL